MSRQLSTAVSSILAQSGTRAVAMDGYTNIKGDEAWIRLSDVIWEVSSGNPAFNHTR